MNFCSNYHDYCCCSCSGCLVTTANDQKKDVQNSNSICTKQPTATVNIIHKNVYSKKSY